MKKNWTLFDWFLKNSKLIINEILRCMENKNAIMLIFDWIDYLIL